MPRALFACVGVGLVCDGVFEWGPGMTRSWVTTGGEWHGNENPTLCSKWTFFRDRNANVFDLKADPHREENVVEKYRPFLLPF